MRRSEAKHNCHFPLSQRPLKPGFIGAAKLLPRPYFPGWGRHVVPVSAGEVGKLCSVEQGEVLRDTEAVPPLGPWPVTITAPPDHHPDAITLAVAVLLGELDVPARMLLCRVLDLCLELIGPAHEVMGGLKGSDPADLSARKLSDHSLDVLIRLRDVARDG